MKNGAFEIFDQIGAFKTLLENGLNFD